MLEFIVSNTILLISIIISIIFWSFILNNKFIGKRYFSKYSFENINPFLFLIICIGVIGIFTILGCKIYYKEQEKINRKKIYIEKYYKKRKELENKRYYKDIKILREYSIKFNNEIKKISSKIEKSIKYKNTHCDNCNSTDSHREYKRITGDISGSWEIKGKSKINGSSYFLFGSLYGNGHISGQGNVYGKINTLPIRKCNKCQNEWIVIHYNKRILKEMTFKYILRTTDDVNFIYYIKNYNRLQALVK